MQARRFAADRFAEAHDDAKLIRAHLEGEGEEGNDRGDADGDEEDERSGQTSPARHHLFELVLAPLQQLLKVGLMMGASGGSLSPRPAASATSAAAAALITPRHTRSPSGVPRWLNPKALRPPRCVGIGAFCTHWFLLEKPLAVSLIGHPHGARKCPARHRSYGIEGDLAP